MSTLNSHATFVLILTGLGLVLFSRKNIPLATTSLLILVLLAVSFTLFPYEDVVAADFFHGFGHQALIAVCGLMILGQGLVRTGALEPLGRLLARAWRASPQFALLLTLVISAILSAFVNNTPIVVLLLPILVSVSMRVNVNASRVLMPVGFATLLGGMSTTIGTSTNLLVVGFANDLGLAQMGMFDFMFPAAVAGGLGLIYLWLIAPRIMPDRTPALNDVSPRVFNAQLMIKEDSASVGKSLFELKQATDDQLRTEQIRRGENTFLVPLPDATIRAGDQLVIQDTPDRLKEFEQILDGTLYAGDEPVDADHPFQAEDQQIAEIVVTEGSLLDRKTLRSVRFQDLFLSTILAIHRAGREVNLVRQQVGDIRLQAGDVLLVQSSREQIEQMKSDGQFLVLDATKDLPFSSKAPYAVAIMIGVVASAALGVMPIAISALAGVLLVLIRCLDWRDIGRSLSEQVILIIVVSLALASALEKTGGSLFLANSFLALTESWPPQWILSALLLLMGFLTNVVSNNAAAVIGTPIAVSMANDLGLPPEAFVLAVLFGSNLSFVTPMAYQTNLLVMSTGGYQFNDFVRVGLPLTFIVWLTLSWVLPALYGFS